MLKNYHKWVLNQNFPHIGYQIFHDDNCSMKIFVLLCFFSFQLFSHFYFQVAIIGAKRGTNETALYSTHTGQRLLRPFSCSLEPGNNILAIIRGTLSWIYLLSGSLLLHYTLL